MNWKERVWFFDTEVLPHDWLFCAISQKGERFECHNDNEKLIKWLREVHPILCGYNSKHYDAYIVKGIMANYEPEGIKEINDAIIVKGIQGWQIEMGWFKQPDYIDLMLDLPTRPSLKLIEGNLKMNIQESSVDFNTEYPTKEQWQELVDYCWHDVEALIPLFDTRLSYLEAKETLAMIGNIDIIKALNMTNAKLTAKYLKATLIERNDEREYVYPDDINKDYIPDEVFDFFNKVYDENISDEELWKSKETIEIIDNVTPTYGWGGCHFAIKHYTGVSDD